MRQRPASPPDLNLLTEPQVVARWPAERSLSRVTVAWQTAVLIVLVVLLGGLFMWALVAQHRAFNSNGWDLGWFDQIVWNSAHGRPFQNSFAPWTFLGEHVEPVLLAFALVYRLKPDPEILLGVQAIVGAAAAVPIYFASESVLRSRTAALLETAAFLISPQFNNAMLFDFHPEVMAVASIFSAFYFLTQNRPGLALIATLSAFLLKEDASLAAIGIAWLFWLYGYRRHSLGLLAVSLAYFVIVTGVIMPNARGDVGGPQARWSYLGDSGPGIVAGAVLHPDRVVRHLVAVRPGKAVGSLLASQAFLPLAGPGAVVAVPLTTAHLLSEHDAEMGLQLHYGALPLALAFVASTLGIARVARWAGKRRLRGIGRLPEARGVVVVAALLLTCELVGAYVGGPFGVRFDPDHYRQTPHDGAVRTVLGMVPKDTSVAAQSGLVPHLSQRREIWEYPPIFGADYVVLDRQSWTNIHGPLTAESDYALATASLPRLGYCLRFEMDGVQLWELAGCRPPPAEPAAPASGGAPP